MYITYKDDIGVIEGIALKSTSSSEKIKEAIIEMNIVREKKVSRDDLIKLIENCSY